MCCALFVCIYIVLPNVFMGTLLHASVNDAVLSVLFFSEFVV